MDGHRSDRPSWGVPVTEDLLKLMVRRIVSEVDPVKIILFGSRARGNAKPDSDVDVVVIKSGGFADGRSKIKETARLYRVLKDVKVCKDILVYSEEDVEYWKDSLNYVLARALREGRVLYERP